LLGLADIRPTLTFSLKKRGLRGQQVEGLVDKLARKMKKFFAAFLKIDCSRSN